MKAYKGVFNKDESEGVFGISLVESPAMEGQFIALSKEQVQFKEVDKDKQILIGLVLEPNKPVYRNQNGNEFTIQFDEDTVRELSYNFFKANYHKNSTIEHQDAIDGVTFVESWIVEDPKNDKGNAFGLSYPKGSWLATMKVDSDEVWNGFVKEGKVLGFSIDAIIKLEEIKMSKQEENKEAETFLSQLSKALGLAKEKEVEVKMGSAKTKDGSVTIEWEGETLEAGVPVFITAEDGTKVPAPVGEHQLEDGNTLVITEEGVLAEVKPMAEEKPMEEVMSGETATSEPTGGDGMDALVAAIKKITVQYAEQKVQEASKENEELVAVKQEVETLKKALAQFKEQPASTPKKSQPSQREGKQSLTEYLNNNL